MKYHFLQVSILFVVLAAIFGISELVSGNMLFVSEEKKLERFAEDVIRICSKESYPPKCYDTEIPKLMDKGLSMEKAFQVTTIVQDKVSDYFYCHVLGHNLSAKETAKDPSRWVEVVARCPAGMCSNGCLHGAAQERFRAEALSETEVRALIPQLSTICEPGHGRDFTGLEQASCYHSLGHLTMYITGADIHTATDVCDEIARKENGENYTQTCYEGAYMQIFQPLEPEDFALVKDIAPQSSAEAKVYCNTFSGEHRAACHRESWPLYREGLTEKGGLESFCSLVTDALSIRRCYNAMFYVLTAQFNFDFSRIVPLCESVPEERKAQCFANAASRFVETDYRLVKDAIRLCEVAKEHGVGDRCYDELLFYSSFNFHKDSEAFRSLCAALPEKWSTRCVNGEGTEISPSKNDF
ncbi:hypothetical protein K2P56_04970 [Patescibacteria group bacterium]|nr:hypothetical protein [Patescibacteria group bacterium]